MFSDYPQFLFKILCFIFWHRVWSPPCEIQPEHAFKGLKVTSGGTCKNTSNIKSSRKRITCWPLQFLTLFETWQDLSIFVNICQLNIIFGCQKIVSAFIVNTEQEHDSFSLWSIGKHTHSPQQTFGLVQYLSWGVWLSLPHL